MRNVKVTLVVSVVLIVVIGALTLKSSPARTVRAGVPRSDVLLDTGDELVACQSKEVVPSGASAVRLSLWAFLGSRVQVRIFSGTRVLTEGERRADWTSDSVTIPIKPVARTVSNARLCFSLSPNSEPILIMGSAKTKQEKAVLLGRHTLAPATVLARTKTQPLGGRVGVAYVTSAPGSWWSHLLTVARHIGLGHVFSGTWLALLIAAVMAAVGTLAVRLTLRELS